jgi:hypothetical protein
VRTVLIVSPNFPPVHTADMHRVRMSLPYYREFGWSPIVLAVRPADQEYPVDPALLASVPDDVPVVRTRAVPMPWGRRLGVGNVAIRAFGHLAAAGSRLIRATRPDLVYFSTTMFAALPLGRIWKRRFGVPFVIDLQDPWFSTYYDHKPRAERPPKYAAARTLHRFLEPWTMRRADGLVAVSRGYVDDMRRRYPSLTSDRCAVIPFGASERDFDIAARLAGLAGSQDPALRHSSTAASCPDRPRGLYIGRGGPDMSTALRILFTALRLGRERSPRLEATRLEFVGTDYAPAGRAQKTVEPVADAVGVRSQVRETTDRAPYFDSLHRLATADFLVLIGSDDPDYSPSKVYPYLLAGRPIVAVVHERSPVADLLRRSGAGVVVTFSGRDDVEGPVRALVDAWGCLVARLPGGTTPDPSVLQAFSARALTARQCDLFERAIQPATVPETQAAACIE